MANIALAMAGSTTKWNYTDFSTRDIQKLFRNLANKYSEHTFWYASSVSAKYPIDFSHFKYDNVRFPLYRCSPSMTQIERRDFTHNSLPPDIAAFIYCSGAPCEVSIPHAFISPSTGAFMRVLNSYAASSGPLHHAINLRPNAKIVQLYNDVRCTEERERDLFRPVDLRLAQTAWTGKTVQRYTSYTDLTLVQQESTAYYAPNETCGLVLDTARPTELPSGRKGFGIALNAAGTKKDDVASANPRFPVLRKWVLSHKDPTIEVFGRWPDELNALDPRMGGLLPIHELHARMKKWKYSLCIPMGPRWVTSKYVELVANGVVPFLHPHYDSDRLVKFPEILRLKHPSDLWDRIHYLDTHEAEYNALWQELYDLVFSEDNITGAWFHRILENLLKDSK